MKVEARTPRGQAVELLDATGEGIAREELERLLAELVAANAFGFRADAGAPLGQPRFAHVQVGGELYRLIVERRSARLERF